MKVLSAPFVLLSSILVSSVAVAADEHGTINGKEVFKAQCVVCHATEGKPTIAPPIFAVKNHVIKKYPERDAFAQRIVAWVQSPHADNALMPGAIGKFGLMPGLPHISEAELTAVGEYLYDTNMKLPNWYAEHYQEEHGELPQ